METHTRPSPADLSNEELVEAVHRLSGSERQATAALVAHLAELEERKLHLAAGCSSLFTYCRDVLHLSEHEAYNRIEAGRAARRFPVILDLLQSGALHLTAVRLLAPHLTPGNHRELLEAARHRSTREVEALVAQVRPRPDVPAAVRRLPAPKASPAPGGEPRDLPAAGGGAPPPAASPGLRAAPSPPSRPVPLAPERFKIQFTAGGEFCSRLRRAQDLLGPRVSPGDLAGVFDRALSLLVEHLEREKHAATERPRPARGPIRPGSRTIPAEVRRRVWARDGGRCAFVGRDGRRCAERRGLEFHHIEPHARGGPATVENISMRCRAHNAYEAVRWFGPRRGDDTPVVREAAPPYGTRFTTSWGPAGGVRWGCRARARGHVPRDPDHTRAQTGDVGG